MQKLLENSQLDPSGSQTWNSRFPLQEKGNSVDVFIGSKKLCLPGWWKKTLTEAKDKAL
jgi:hypothetical protein